MNATIKNPIRAKPVIQEVRVDAPVSKVWKAITDTDEMKQWYFDIKEFKPEVGFEFKYYGQKEGKKYPTSCRILEVKKERKEAVLRVELRRPAGGDHGDLGIISGWREDEGAADARGFGENSDPGQRVFEGEPRREMGSLHQQVSQRTRGETVETNKEVYDIR
jgi:hypothetical protein